jgi:hypothetical protein
MKRIGVTVVVALAASAALAALVVRGPGTPAANPVSLAMPGCTQRDLVAVTIREDEAAAHRRFPVPVLRYAQGTRLDAGYRDRIRLRVDRDGHVACASLSREYGEAPPRMTPERRRALDGLAAVRFTPFVRDGATVPAIVELPLREADRTTHREMPNVALDQVRIRLQRSGCFGTCPSYSVDILGDGRVRYVGRNFVSVEGAHEFRIPQTAVADLVAHARALDIWSMEPAYRAPITDNPTYRVQLDLGDASHAIEDYVGEKAGMPPEVTQFEDEIDRVSHALDFVHLTSFAVDVLEREGFAFASPAGAAMLAEATSDEDVRDDAALVRLLALGAPMTGAPTPHSRFAWKRPPLIEEALLYQRTPLVEALLDRGALETDHRIDLAKRDAALVAAIRGGKLALVQRIWNLGAKAPALTFVDTSRDERHVVRASLALALESPRYRERPWEGIAIARWLEAQGVDLRGHRADGDTLLHIATDGEDIAFVRALLDMGLDPNARGDFGYPALSSTTDEDIVLLLLQKGTDVSVADHRPGGYLRYARSVGMWRVAAWLESRSNQAIGNAPSKAPKTQTQGNFRCATSPESD